MWAEHLKPFGQSKKVSVRHSIAHVPHDRNLKQHIQNAMKFEPVQFDDDQRAAIADGISEVVDLLKVRLFACAVLPDHVHLVPERHIEDVETLVGYFKRAATKHLTRIGIHPMRDATRSRDGAAVTPWVRGGWNRYINNANEIPGAVDYVRQNWARAKLEEIVYPFVKPLDHPTV